MTLLSPIETQFAQFDAQAAEYRDKALSIVVKGIEDTQAMADARAMRLELKAIRVAGEKLRKVLKADALEYGRAVDAAYRRVEDAIVPLEEHLDAQEKFVLRLQEEAKAKRIAARRAEMAAIDPVTLSTLSDEAIGVIHDEAWAVQLENARLAAAARTERLAKEAAERAERIRLEEAERLERERIAKEQKAEIERLRAEVAREAAEKAAAERERRRAEAAFAEQVRAAQARELNEARTRSASPTPGVGPSLHLANRKADAFDAIETREVMVLPKEDGWVVSRTSSRTEYGGSDLLALIEEAMR